MGQKHSATKEKHVYLNSFLGERKVEELVREHSKPLLIINVGQTIRDTLQLLATNKVLGAPVFDSAKQTSDCGFIDVLDLAAFLRGRIDWNNPADFFNRPVEEAIGTAGRARWLEVPAHTSLLTLFDKMEQAKVHRVAVVENNAITHLITQTDLITFLYNNLSRFHPIGDESLHELALDIPTREIFTVPESELVLDAFVSLSSAGVSAAAIVDPSGCQVGQLSAADLRGFDEHNFMDLKLPVKEYLKKRGFAGLHTCLPSARLQDVLGIMVKAHLHRMFVVDETSRPHAVVAISDIIKVFASVK
jgi:predicted transcriptional regulator